MAFDLEEFKSNINSVGGLSKLNKFAVYLTAPPFISGVASSYDSYSEDDLSIGLSDNMQLVDGRMLSMLCSNIDLPGKSLQVLEYRPQTFGKISKVPYDVHFDPLPAQFFLDNDQRVLNFFNYWMQEIINTDSEMQSGPNSTYKNRTSYELNYKKNYSTTMLIQFYADNDDSVFTEYEFHDVYPMQLGSIQLGWDRNDQIAILPVEFSHSGYTIFRGSLSSGTYASRGVDYYQLSSLYNNTLSALTDVNYSIRNLIETVTRI